MEAEAEGSRSAEEISADAARLAARWRSYVISASGARSGGREEYAAKAEDRRMRKRGGGGGRRRSKMRPEGEGQRGRPRVEARATAREAAQPRRGGGGGGTEAEAAAPFAPACGRAGVRKAETFAGGGENGGQIGHADAAGGGAARSTAADRPRR